MTLAPANKNISLTYELANWLNSKSSEPSTKIKCYLSGRIALVSFCLFSLAEAVSRATVGSMLIAGSCGKKAKNFGIAQIQKGAHAGSISLDCFRSIISSKDLADCLEAAKPKKILPPEKRLNRIRKGEKLIADKLKKELNCAKTQAAKESNKAFKYLSAPADFKPANFTRVVGKNIEAGICYYTGQRKSMEDEDLVASFQLIVKDSTYPVQLFGVFDGHGGSWASRYVKLHLKEQLQETLKEGCTDELTDEAIWNALKTAFVRLHKGLAKGKNERDLSRMRGGTTATVAMILNEKLWVTNTGDSRAILDNGCQLSEDAKPENPRYKRGIESRGGKVLTIRKRARVEGSLSLARALGDYNVKGINPRPKITMCPLSEIPKESHLILACDGIYDVSSTRQVAAAVKAHKDCSAAQLAKNIVYSAYQAGSKDNLSVLVVKF